MINTWECKLRSILQRQPEQENHLLRISLIGIGYELGGDDAAGISIIRRLTAVLPEQERLQLIEAATAPENITGAVRRFQPDLIVLFDAADFYAQPGEIGVLDWREITGYSASTHSLPLHVFAAYLNSELGCPVELVGIQPFSLKFDEPISAPVDQAIQALVSAVSKLLSDPI